jgi:hypothetical protein
MTRTTGYNSTYKKLAVQCLNEALCFVSSSVLADSLVLRNPLLRQAPNRYRSVYKASRTFKHIWFFSDTQSPNKKTKRA